ncbi:hypothetical protein VKT23_019010 [Stygiomarasmius scandens]|uniref:Uncharacterized protein n=1 Tax=Marasmiellus scandens TaxID=2682957 RepID=A0ABR1IQ25_9AGAR
MTERPTTVSLYGDAPFFPDATISTIEVTPIGTAEDGSQTTLHYTIAETDNIVIHLETEINGIVFETGLSTITAAATRTDTAIVVVSSGGFRAVKNAPEFITGTTFFPGWTSVYDCAATDENGGRCLISGNDAQPTVVTGTGIPWVLLITESNPSSTV